MHIPVLITLWVCLLDIGATHQLLCLSPLGGYKNWTSQYECCVDMLTLGNRCCHNKLPLATALPPAAAPAAPTLPPVFLLYPSSLPSTTTFTCSTHALYMCTTTHYRWPSQSYSCPPQLPHFISIYTNNSAIIAWGQVIHIVLSKSIPHLTSSVCQNLQHISLQRSVHARIQCPSHILLWSMSGCLLGQWLYGI